MCFFFLCEYKCGFSVFFFFSSRRRHTRSLCDWSSDVCSSDLSRPGRVEQPFTIREPATPAQADCPIRSEIPSLTALNRLDKQVSASKSPVAPIARYAGYIFAVGRPGKAARLALQSRDLPNRATHSRHDADLPIVPV